MSNGFVAYEGLSSLGPRSVSAIVTGTWKPSANSGTGPMLQMWIMDRFKHPVEVVRNGEDGSICGDCAFRAQAPGGRSRGCYVNLMAPGSVWKQYRDGNYGKVVRPDAVNWLLRRSPMATRVGAYGDPAALPYDFWKSILRGVNYTGYTSQWETCDRRLSSFFMASVRSADEYHRATAAGWRTFRARLPDDPILKGEFVCPKTTEGGEKAQCAGCLLCDGTATRAKNPVAIVHGNAAVLKAATSALVRIGVATLQNSSVASTI